MCHFNVGVKVNYSYSKIQDAYTCLRLFKIKHIDGIVIDHKSGDMEFGNAIHHAMEQMFKPQDEFSSDPVDNFTTYWDMAKSLELTYTRFKHEDLRAMGQEFIRRFVKLHKRHFEPFKVEERINFKVGSHDFNGKPDFIGEYKGIPSIVDFKTSAYAYDKRKIVVDEQMYIYADAVYQVYGYKPKQLVYIVFCKGDTRIQTVTLPIDKENVTANMNNVELMANDLSERKEWPMNKKSCLSCTMYDKCYPKETK